MSRVSRVGSSEVRENEDLLCAVMKAETVLTAQTVISGGRKNNGSKTFLFVNSYLVAIPEILHPVFISTGKRSLFICREDSIVWD